MVEPCFSVNSTLMLSFYILSFKVIKNEKIVSKDIKPKLPPIPYLVLTF